MAKAMLMRDFIHRALYFGSSAYFSKPVIAASAPIDFSNLLGASEWNRRVAALYAASSRGWLTPVELFKPWYSYAIASSVLESAGKGASELRVFEVGGGTGTNAVHFLNFVRAMAPSLYARPGGVSYTILEISPELSQRQAEALEGAGHGRGTARSLCMDAMRAHESLRDERPCTVLALEVLDNLPHDKVVCLDGTLHETWVEEEVEVGVEQQQQQQQQRQASQQGGRPARKEAFRPLQDPLIAHVWAEMEAHGNSSSARSSSAGSPTFLPALRGAAAGLCRALPLLPQRGPLREPPRPRGFQWALHVPTGCAALLRSLTAALPAHRLLLADFSHLPHPTAALLRTTPPPGEDARPREHPVLCHAPADALPGCGGPPWVPWGAGKKEAVAVAVSPASPLGLRGLVGRPGGGLLASGLGQRLICAPLLVASKGVHAGQQEEGVGEWDHATYLHPGQGEADIYFPTDFALLAHLVSGQSGGAAAVHTSKDFLTRHGRWERTSTLTGFNPMLERYKNTRFLTTL